MRRCTWVLIALLGSGCVDLTPPKELGRGATDAEVDAGSAGLDAAADAAAAGPDTGRPGTPDAGAGPPDTAPPTPPDASPGIDVPVIPTDAAAPADVAGAERMADLPGPSPDLAASPDAAPDAPVIPDTAPDTTPDVGLDVGPDVGPDLGPDAAPDVAPDLAPDVSPDAPVLVIDDYQTGATAMVNNLGSEVTWDNQNCSRAAGEMTCAWNGNLNYQDFIETINKWCGFDARGYSKVRFRARASMAGRRVDVLAGVTPGACFQLQTPQTLLGSFNTTTTMTTYEFDLTGVARERLVLIELVFTVLDSTQYVLDDLHLVP